MNRARILAAIGLTLPFLLGATAAPATEDGRALCRIADDRIVEASGLVAIGSPADGLLVTVNDSGDEGRVFVLDAGSCETVGVLGWAESPDDVEALAPGPATDRAPGVWVGDIGDNPGTRDTVRLGLLPVEAGDRDVSPQWTDLRYTDGPRDAEALLRHPGTGRLFVISKRVLGGAVYAVPDRVAPGAVGEMRKVGGVMSLVTDGAFWPDGRHVILRNYGRATVYAWPALEPVASFDLPPEPQGEALAVTPDGRVLVTSEGTRQPVLEVALPAEVRAELERGASPGAGTGARTGSGQREVPGEAAGPAASDNEEGGPRWPGIAAAAGAAAGLALVLRLLLRRPGAGSGPS